ncbi:MAG: hypothetical protein WAO91_04630 [Candidatus Nitrosotenuis sp.]
MGYKEAQELFKKKYGITPKSSWIANVLNDHGKIKNRSPARKGNYKYPCPEKHRDKLEKVLKELKLL